jgi:hypothetical protein
MGNSQVSVVKNVVDAVNETTTNVRNTSITDGRAVALNRNTLFLELGPTGEINCTKTNIGQTITVDQNLKVLSKFESVTDLQTMLSSIVDQTSETKQKAVNEFLSLGVNSQVSKQDLITNIKNSITANITNENITRCNAVVDNINDAKIIINGKINCPSGGTLNITQDILATQQVSCISESLFSAAVKNQAIADIVQKATADQDAKNNGLLSLCNGLFLYIAIGVGSIIFICIIAAIIFAVIKMNSRKGKSSKSLPKSISM